MGSLVVNSDAPVPACMFSYPLTASQSAFPGNPPAMQTQTSTSCGPPFTTRVDPMGAASVSASATVYQQAQPSVCAIDMYVPSS
jgi:hypothetical protein